MATRECPGCGANLADDPVEGLCPRCGLSQVPGRAGNTRFESRAAPPEELPPSCSSGLGPARPGIRFLAGLLELLVIVEVMFVTMRASNGYAAVHDLLTGTRVVVRPRT